MAAKLQKRFYKEYFPIENRYRIKNITSFYMQVI